MRIFNADGSEVMMCGNASRCIGKYVYDNKLTQKKVITLETLSGIKVLKLHTENELVEEVTVDMDLPLLANSRQINTPDGKMLAKTITVDGKEYKINPEKPDVPLNKNDAFQKVQKRRVQENGERGPIQHDQSPPFFFHLNPL